MKFTPKKSAVPLILSISSLAFTIILAGCALFGANPKPPSAAEKAIFDVVTNTITKVVPIEVTNVHQVMVEVPVFKTNELNQVVWSTNTVQQNVTNISIATVTVTNETYTLTPKDSTKAIVAGAGTAVNTFFPGVGGMISTGIAAALGLWAQLRSTKRGSALAGTTQEIETIREFVKALPNGEHIDSTVVDWLQQHQGELGVVNTLAPLVDKVSNPEAKAAAQQLIDTVNALLLQKAATPPAATVPSQPIGPVKLS